MVDPASAAEAHIAARATEYDLAALIVDLRTLGYSDEAIEFRSNQTRVHQAALIEAVEFTTEPSRRAIIEVNLSLLSPQSPLPTYFQKILDEQAENSLAAFLNFFAHRLLRADVLGMFPERDPTLFADFARTKKQIMSLLGVRSPSTMHWMFQAIFPELEVAVKRTMLLRPIRTRGMVIGEWKFGDGSVCGGLAQVPVSAIAVTLFCDDAETFYHQPWARAAHERLNEVLFPLLAIQGTFLEVSLVFRDQSSFMVLAPQQFLGYEPLYKDEAPRDPLERTCRTVIIFSGEVPARWAARR